MSWTLTVSRKHPSCRISEFSERWPPLHECLYAPPRRCTNSGSVYTKRSSHWCFYQPKPKYKARASHRLFALDYRPTGILGSIGNGWTRRDGNGATQNYYRSSSTRKRIIGIHGNSPQTTGPKNPLVISPNHCFVSAKKERQKPGNLPVVDNATQVATALKHAGQERTISAWLQVLRRKP